MSGFQVPAGKSPCAAGDSGSEDVLGVLKNKERLYSQTRSIMLDNKEKSVALPRQLSAAPTSPAAGRRLCPPGTPRPPSAAAPPDRQALPLSRCAAGLSPTYCRPGLAFSSLSASWVPVSQTGGLPARAQPAARGLSPRQESELKDLPLNDVSSGAPYGEGPPASASARCPRGSETRLTCTALPALPVPCRVPCFRFPGTTLDHNTPSNLVSVKENQPQDSLQIAKDLLTVFFQYIDPNDACLTVDIFIINKSSYAMQLYESLNLLITSQ